MGQVHTEQSEETRVWLRQRLSAAVAEGGAGGGGGLVAGRWQNVHTHRSQSRPGLVQTLPGGASSYIPLSPLPPPANSTSASSASLPPSLPNAASHAV